MLVKEFGLCGVEAEDIFKIGSNLDALNSDSNDSLILNPNF